MTAPNPPAQATANICNTRGLHARASAKFVKLASTYEAEIHVTRDGVTVNALSIMGLLMLEAPETAASSTSPPRAPRRRLPWRPWRSWWRESSTRTHNDG